MRDMAAAFHTAKDKVPVGAIETWEDIEDRRPRATIFKGEPLFVSRDNYIVDGHHRWAALVGLDAEDNRLGNDKTISVIRVEGMDIIELIFWANKFTEEMGIPRAGV